MYRGYLKLTRTPTPESIIARYELARDVLEVGGEILRAREEHDLVVTESRKLGDTNSEALGWLGLGRVRWVRKQLDEAERCLEQALTLSRTARNRWTESPVLAHLALVYSDRDRTAEALAIFETAVRTGVALGVRDEGTIFGRIVHHFLSEGSVEGAFALYRQAMELRRGT